MLQSCAICHYLERPGRGATSLIGLLTGLQCVLDAAEARLDDGVDGKPHIMAQVCAEHVIDIYRGRIPGVAMAWRTGTRV